MRKHESGFTLIELMIVIAIIAIIAAIAIPNLLAAKLSANETAAIATLRNLVSCQAQAQTSGKIDCDVDGIGEYGCFLELTGTVGVRKGPVPMAGSPPACDWTIKGTVINPPILSSALANVDVNGYVTKSGYAFMIFLPDGAVPAQFANEVGGAAAANFSAAVGCDLAETTWCAYAQPVIRGNTGNRAFFCNQAGDVMQSPNDEVGKEHQGVAAGGLNGNSAFLAAGITAPVAVGKTGQDGNDWKVTN